MALIFILGLTTVYWISVYFSIVGKVTFYNRTQRKKKKKGHLMDTFFTCVWEVFSLEGWKHFFCGRRVIYLFFLQPSQYMYVCTVAPIFFIALLSLYFFFKGLGI